MNKTIICSVGTSAAKNVSRSVPLLVWVQERGGPHPAATVIHDQFRAIRPEGEALREHLAAEIHSLVRIGVDESDRVLLLASETDDGFACALAVGICATNGLGLRCMSLRCQDYRFTMPLISEDVERWNIAGVVYRQSMTTVPST